MTAKNRSTESMARHASHKVGTRSASPQFELVTELKTFEQKLPELLESSAGKFVIIKSRDILGIADDYTAALKIGYRQLGSDTAFFVEQVEDPKISAKRNKVFLTKLEWLK
jgi:hypothetical protein